MNGQPDCQAIFIETSHVREGDSFVDTRKDNELKAWRARVQTSSVNLILQDPLMLVILNTSFFSRELFERTNNQTDGHGYDCDDHSKNNLLVFDISMMEFVMEFFSDTGSVPRVTEAVAARGKRGGGGGGGETGGRIGNLTGFEDSA